MSPNMVADVRRVNVDFVCEAMSVLVWFDRKRNFELTFITVYAVFDQF